MRIQVPLHGHDPGPGQGPSPFAPCLAASAASGTPVDQIRDPTGSLGPTAAIDHCGHIRELLVLIRAKLEVVGDSCKGIIQYPALGNPELRDAAGKAFSRIGIV